MKNITEANLIYLIEECSEVIHAATKILRFTSADFHPVTGVNTADHLEEEICQLVAIIDKFEIDDDLMDGIIEAKYEKLKEYEPLERLSDEEI